MKPIKILGVHEANFLAASPEISGLPSSKLPELAMVGRSNVGKSSFINLISQRKALARVSNTPGRTQQVNLFHLDLRLPNNKLMGVGLLDLPGLGYAVASKKERERFFHLVLDVIAERSELVGVVLIVDIRREPGEHEYDIAKAVYGRGVPLIIVANKIDKINAREKMRQLRILSEYFPKSHLVGISAASTTYFAESWRVILEAVESP
jgi:GTP-binding protein